MLNGNGRAGLMVGVQAVFAELNSVVCKFLSRLVNRESALSAPGPFRPNHAWDHFAGLALRAGKSPKLRYRIIPVDVNHETINQGIF